jgi:anti-sigma B factor antagonist
MGIRVEHYHKKSVITINSSEFIGTENKTLQNLIKDSISKGSKNILVDLSKVKRISSWGIGGLVHAYITCINRTVKFDIGGINKSVMNVLNNVKLDMVFHIVNMEA